MDVSDIAEFDWDKGNSEKNWRKHKVSINEAQEVFFNEPLLISDDVAHSKHEPRFHSLGKTNANRLLHITFTIRKGKVRVISARNMSKKEKVLYEKTT